MICQQTSHNGHDTMTWKFQQAAGVGLVFALIAMSFVALAVSSAHAQDDASGIPAPELVLIFDGSGSMWGKLKGGRRAKFQLARDALRAALEPRPSASFQFGITGFGYRRRGNCSGIETPADMAPFAQEDSLAPLARWNPQGRGPIGRALEQAGEMLAGAQGPRRILLVHDGPDNCRADVCAITQQLKETMPDLMVDVVTLRDRDGAPIMACIGAITGGTVQEVSTDAEIAPAIAAAVQRLLAAPERQRDTPDAEAPKPPKANALSQLEAGVHEREGTRQLIALARARGLKQATAAAVSWTITPTSSADRGAASAPIQTLANQFAVSLPAGTYQVEARSGAFSARQEVMIKDGRSSILIVEFDAAELVVAVTVAERLKDAPVSIRLAQAGADIPIAVVQGRQAGVLVRAGTYDVRAQLGEAAQVLSVTADIGTQAAVAIQLAAGRLDIAPVTNGGASRSVISVRTQGGEAAAGSSALSVSGDASAQRAPVEIARSAARAPSFFVPPGAYQIIRETARGSVQRRVMISDGEAVTLRLDQPGGKIMLRTRIAGRAASDADGVSYVIRPADGRAKRDIRVHTAEGEITLEPGGYEILSVLSEYGISTRASLIVTPGLERTIIIDHTVGGLKLAAPADLGARERARVVWDIRGPDGARVWRDIGDGAVAFLPPASYTVRAIAAGRVREVQAVVKPGETLPVQF